MKAVACIFARGGSKGLPGKNIRNFGGKPLIAWSIQQALEVARIDRVIVSTDSEEIASIARMYGAEVPFIRPEWLSQDDSPEWLAWRHLLCYIRDEKGGLPEVMISVPATAPLRLSNDIDECLNEYENGAVDMVITVTEARRNPYFNMIKKGADGLVDLVNRSDSAIFRRQDAPVVYDMATVCYVADPKFVMTHDSIFAGRVKAVQIPVERAVDIDTLHDFEMAEYFLRNAKRVEC